MISVFTPTHDTRYLLEAYESLKAQTFKDWEWIVLINGPAAEADEAEIGPTGDIIDTIEDDCRVQVYTSKQSGSVGALKREAIEHCSGDILVEFDHDDLLTEDCLHKVDYAFRTYGESIGFVYSDCAEITAEGLYTGEKWNAAHGWTYEDCAVKVAGATRNVNRGFYPEPLPSNLAYIWYAPNHVRAFRRSVYDSVGGYNPDLKVLDDHDLMVRLYEATQFYHIHDCLYLQRMHTGMNTQKNPELNAQIQQGTISISDQWIEKLTRHWSEENGLEVLDFTKDNFNGYTLSAYGEDSVGLITCRNSLQYMDRFAADMFINEAYRVLVHGGMLLTVTPSTDGRLAFQDPQARSYWNENSFWYYVNPVWTHDQDPPHFQLTRSMTYYPDQWHHEAHLAFVRADLCAIKEGPRVFGVNLWKEIKPDVI